jgi:ABC-type Na+ efflux pump permease subunit/membrane protease YdiL (CAAX protease family)
MTTEDQPPSQSATPTQNRDNPRAPRRFRLSRLALKELRETLRDRRTIVTLILMPLLVYPTLSLVFKTFLLTNAGMFTPGEAIKFQIAYGGNASEQRVTNSLAELGRRMGFVEQERAAGAQSGLKNSEVALEPSTVQDEKEKSNSTEPDSTEPDSTETDDSQFVSFQKHGWILVKSDSALSMEEIVEAGAADVGVRFLMDERAEWEIGKVELISRNDQVSSAAADYLLRRFEEINDSDLKFRLRRFKIPDGYTLEVSTKTLNSEVESKTQQPFPLASMVPLILVLMTITGAVYPAIDLTAGERERGTLETLMAAPVPRMGILWSKFIAVLTVAILTAMLNLIGMFATVWVFQLDKQFGGGIFNLEVMLKIFLLLILFAAFFSALLLVVTSFAKSFKEAQVYLIPIILLSLGPGLISMAPGMSMDGINCVIPMVNILLLARDVIQGQVMMLPAIVAIVTTLLYSYLALRLAARIFGSDSILYSGGGSFAEMFHRPFGPNFVVPVMATLFCLVMLFPINFASIGFLGRMPAETPADLEVRYLTMSVFTFLAFLVLPWLVAKHQSTLIQPGFGLNRPKLIFLVAGALLGVSMWPLVMSLTEGWHEVYGLIFGSEKQDEWHKRLVETTAAQVERIRMVSPWIIALAFSIVPAICEEWFFRGMLLRSLLKSKSAVKAILISALVFGSFHVLSNSVIALDRLIPSTLIGIMLGYLAYKSNSIVPGIILHSLNNAFVIFLAYYQPQLSEQAWFPADDQSIPRLWVVVGLVVAAVGAALVWQARRVEPDSPVVEKEEQLANAT